MRNLIFLSALMLVFSCKKDKNNGGNGGGSGVPLVKTITNIDTNGNEMNSTSYVYDNNGRMTLVEDYSITFTYSGNQVIMQYPSGSKHTYVLNGSGLSDSGYYFDAMKNLVTSAEKRTFNTDTQPTLYKSYSWDMANPTAPLTSNSYEVYEYAQGNMTVRSTYIYDTLFSKEEFTYDLAHNNTIDNANFGRSFLGKGSKNPVLTKTLKVGPFQANYQYENHFDNKGRIDTLKEFWNGVLHHTEAYSYH